MAKKKEFQWTAEQSIGIVEVNERERRLVKLCSLELEETENREAETRWYVCITTLKYFKDVWNPVKNAVFPLDTWFEIVELVNENVEFEE